MVARNRLPPWHEELTLSNGRKILIRPIHPDDAEPLRASYGRQHQLIHFSGSEGCCHDSQFTQESRPAQRLKRRMIAN